MKNIKELEIFKYEKRDCKYVVSFPYTKYLEGNSSKEVKLEESELETLIKKLLNVKNCKVEEYENGILTKEGYPGNWKDFSDICLDHKIPPSLCGIKIHKNTVDLTFIKATEFFLFSCSFEDDDVFSNLYTILSEINAYEVLYDDRKIDFLLESLGILTHFCKTSPTSKDLVKKFLKTDNLVEKVYIRPNICIIDDNILDSLNIYKVGESCVFDNFKCYTVQGKRLLLQFFKQPLKNKEEIEARLNIIENIRNVDLEVLKDFPDLLKITKKILNMKISLIEILKLHQIVLKIPILLNKVNVSSLRDDFYVPLYNISANISNVLSDIENVIDVKGSNRNIVKFMKTINNLTNSDTCHENFKLNDLYMLLENINKECKEEFVKIHNICDKIKYEEGDDSFRITKTEYKKFEALLKGKNILITNILKNGINFTTKRMSELTLERNNVKECISKETNQIVNELRLNIKKYINEFEILNYITALLDVFSAIGKKSRDFGYSRPKFNDSKAYIDIQDGFHPLLEDKNFITNSLSMDQKKMCIITGPNMGGKSTYLKMVGVISVLAQVGCYVPARAVSLPIFDGIYIRIGANDCTHKGSSTFMVEMKDIARICRMSTNKSLILIDELGRGTSELDGLSIAKAVKNYLYKKQCLTLFATHFPELCSTNTVNKKALSDKLVLLYKIVDGICDISWGINVAEMVGFPRSVLEDIKRV